MCKLWSKYRESHLSHPSPIQLLHNIAWVSVVGVRDMVTILVRCVQSMLGRSLRQPTCAYFSLHCMGPVRPCVRCSVEWSLCVLIKSEDTSPNYN